MLTFLPLVNVFLPPPSLSAAVLYALLALSFGTYLSTPPHLFPPGTSTPVRTELIFFSFWKRESLKTKQNAHIQHYFAIMSVGGTLAGRRVSGRLPPLI